MRVAYPPSTPQFGFVEPALFLAGSIEMGNSVDWQSQVCEALKDKAVLVLNPRRPDWDSSWEQSIDNPLFVEQVVWELDMLQTADHIVMYLDPATKAPVSLLELGLYASKRNMLVCCPDGFWRKGNVEIVCNRFRIPVVHTFDDLISRITKWYGDIGTK